MGRIFTVNPKYYDDNRKLYKHNKFEIEPGITILIGCNGCFLQALFAESCKPLLQKVAE